MKFLVTFFLSISVTVLAEPIPARDPYIGESRPSWWWDIWYGRVVVLEGEITFKKLEEPDVKISISEKRKKEIIPDDEIRDLQANNNSYYVGELEISKFHYTDGGASATNGWIEQMRSGKLKKVKVLIPIMGFGDKIALYGMNLHPDQKNKGIHVLEYSNMILGLNYVHRSTIPKENLSDAEKVFRIREGLVHHGKSKLHPNQGYAGFEFRAGKESIIVEKVIDGTPAKKSGLKEGDRILSVNGKKVTDPDLGIEINFYSMIYEWRAGNQLELGVRRGDKNLQLELDLISLSDLGKLIPKEQGDPAGPKK